MKILKSLLVLSIITINLFGQDNQNYNYFLTERNKLAFDLFNMLETNHQNDIFSPYFLNFSFSEIYLATKGNTSLQIAAFAYFRKEKDIHSQNITEYQKIITEKNKLSPQFNYSINFFVDDSIQILEEFKKLVNNLIIDSISHINFSQDSIQYANDINEQINQKTNGKIKDIFKPEFFIQKPSLVVSSEVYFKGTWANNFLEYLYSPFYSDSITQNVKYLTTNAYFKYSESSEYQIIDIPYQNYDMDLLIILPKNDTTLENIYNYFNYNSFQMWQRNMLQTKRIRVIIPQISVEGNYNIQKVIKNICPFIFMKGANYTYMVKKLIYVTNFRHVTKFEFQANQFEKEIEEIDFEKEMSTNTSLILNANHPFLYILIDKKNQTILLMGKYFNP